ncbi:MAG: glycoside hydrolase, partial [Armatimonadetes bacterium]|nr:glycoside hydrolase [Armatimonadota bacterium]
MLESNNGVVNGRWVHPLAKPLEIDRNGPFVVLDDGSLGMVDEHGFRISKDDGKTWSEAVPVCKGINPKEPASFYLLRTRNNTLVLVYLNFAEYRFEWDEERKEPKE